MDFSPEEFDEILNIFRAETEEIIEKLNNNLLSLENTPKDKDILMHMFRDAHSLKGAARMIGFNNIQRLAHKIEDVLGLAKENKIVINSTISDVLYKSLDFLSEIIQKSISIKKEYYTDDIQKYIDNIDKTLEIHDSDLYTNDRDIAIKSEAENFDIKNFRKNVSTLDAQIIESFLIMSKMEMDDDIKYLDTFYDIVQKLIEILKPFNLYEINSILQDIEMKLAFVMQNSHIITKEEQIELHKKFDEIVEYISEIYKKYNIPMSDYKSLVKNKLAYPDGKKTVSKFAPEENKEKETAVASNLENIKTELNEIEQNLSRIPDINEALEHIISLNINPDANQVIQKIIEVLGLIKKSNELPEKEIITILKQSICSCEKMLTKHNKDEKEDVVLIIQRLDIIKQMLDLTASVNPLTTLSENIKESNPPLQKPNDFFNSYEATSIKTLRVDTKKLDKLVNQTGELIISRIKHKKHLSELDNILEEISEWKSFNHKSQSFIKYYDKKLLNAITMGDLNSLSVFSKQIYSLFQENSARIIKLNNHILGLQKSIDEDDTKLNLIVNQLENMVKNIRVLPLATIFHMFPRMIRDISKDTGKEIELLISGSETSADKKIIEEIKSPLIHIIRNSIDHGIESPEERVEHGKSPVGKIHLHAKNLENKILIEITDDGRGIDLEKIKQRAIDKKLITPKECAYLTDEQVMNMIFWSGFSTGDTVTEISGRGVGLDIVQTKIAQLNGKVKVFSLVGRGTKISIELPVSMSTLKSFIVEASNQLFALPMSSIKTVMWVNNEDIYFRNDIKSVLIDGSSTPVYYLSELLELPVPEKFADEKHTLVVIEIENSYMGLIVDSIVGDQEILHKKLSAPIIKLKNISGITTLVTGKVCLILNLPELYKNTYIGKDKALENIKNRLIKKENKDYRILVVDDSITTRALMKNIFNSRGYSYEMVKNPKEAFEMLAEKKFDIIISDLEMPEMSGIEFLNILKTNEKYSKIPVIILSSYDGERTDATEYHADAFITKSEFNQDYLLQIIRNLLE